MHELYLTGIFLFVLFLLLGTGVWIGLALLGRGLGRHDPVHQQPRGRRHDHHDLDGVLVMGAHRPAAVHLDGRDPVSHPPVRGHVPRPQPLAGELAGSPAAYQRRRLHGVRRGLGELGGHGGHDRQDVDPGAAPARLSGAADRRLARGRRHARPDDPAVADPDRLRRHDQRIDLQAVHRRRPARAGPGGPVHGLRHVLVAPARGPGAAGADHEPARQARAQSVPDSRGLPDPRRPGLDLSRDRDGDRGGRVRRDRRAAPGASPRAR